MKHNLINNNTITNRNEYVVATKKCPRIYSLSIVLVIIILAGFLRNLFSVINQKNISVTIVLKNKIVHHTVSEKFISFGLDSSLLRNMENLPIKNERFINLTHYLSPAYLRIGGTAADCLYFNETSNAREELPRSTLLNQTFSGAYNISTFTINELDFLSLYEFSQKSNVRIMFDLNVLSRNIDGTWDSRNVRNILSFAKSQEMKLDWQLGNEPNSFLHVFKIRISAEQLAKDYCELRNLLDEMGYEECILVGPEANHIGDENHSGEIYTERFLNNVKNCVDYATWHQYYLNGHIAQVKDFINLNVFDRLPIQINKMNTVIQSSGQNISMWLSETSSAYGGGAANLSDKFVAGFLWLDKLGFSARAGIQVVIRQSLLGGHYAMIGPDLKPNPDWWLTILFKKFVSRKVLTLLTNTDSKKVRFYAHCASKQFSTIESSTIVIYGMNLNNEETDLVIQGLPEESKMFSYILSSDDLQSRNISLNGKILVLSSDGSLPDFEPKIQLTNQLIPLPPFSMAFLLISDVNIPACFS